MKWLIVVISCCLIYSCGTAVKTLKYGYLPGGDYQYYAPIEKSDLKGKSYNLVITDDRSGVSQISCSDIILDRNTELEGDDGFNFFSKYCRAMIEANNGIIDQDAQETIHIKLKGLSAQYYGFGFLKVHGLVEFDVILDNFEKTYCSDMVDGDEDAPLKATSITTRKGALKKMVSGSTRRALEMFTRDLALKL
jgi:hypothetical protein